MINDAKHHTFQLRAEQRKLGTTRAEPNIFLEAKSTSGRVDVVKRQNGGRCPFHLTLF
jgi:hypothetical protein